MKTIARIALATLAIAGACLGRFERFGPTSSLTPKALAASPAELTRPFEDLSGDWQFELDRDDSGVRQQWYNRRLRAPIKLPGILQAQFYGNEITKDTPWVMTLYDHYWYLRDDYKDYVAYGRVKVPFLSQPPRHYLGPAWYQRDIDIPAYMVNRRIVLTLERPHWETTVWVDGNKIGSDKSLVAPHVYDLGSITAGRHRLTIRVDNRTLLPYRLDSHSISDSLGASWNGIVGRIDLSDTGRVWIDDAQVFPNLEQKSMLIKVKIGNVTGRSGAGTITAIWPDIGIVPVNWDEKGGSAEVEVPLRLDTPTWDEFHPRLQQLRLWLRGTGFEEYKDVRLGIRDFKAEGKHFVLNGVPINFRGTNNGGDFPLTGYPPTDLKSWTTIFETCKAWGLNHMRFHSWCPPEAAFEAADQVGFYLQPEPGFWNEIAARSDMEKMLYDETERMIKTYGNHPSFMLLSASNAPRGEWKGTFTRWLTFYKQQDRRRLYTAATGHSEREVAETGEGVDFLAMQRNNGNMLRGPVGWFGNDYREALADVKVPMVANEVGQWAAYPDYEVIKKFKNAYLRPGNYEIFQESLKAHGLLYRNSQFARASGHFQLECYKEEIEANLRTPDLGGFQLLDLHDYLGRGTAPVGMLDAFWEAKSYVAPEDFKQFCNTTVPLARLGKRVFTTAERFDVGLELAHFGAEPIEDGKAVWRVVGGQFEPKGECPTQNFPIGKNISLGQTSIDLSTFKPGEYRLILTVAPASFFNAERKIASGPKAIRGVTYFENQWNFWVYPATNEPVGFNAAQSSDCPPSRSPDVLVTSSWDEAEAKLAAGGKVLFVPRNADLDWSSPPLDIVPVSWSRLLTPSWNRMMGIWVDIKPTDTKSKAMMSFFTGPDFDWQWAELLRGVRAVNLDGLPAELEPVVWGIDDWNRNHKLGIIFECAVADGRLLVSAIDVTNPVPSNPVLLQLRRSLLNYMRTDCFQPQVAVTIGQIHRLLFDTHVMRRLGAKALGKGEFPNSAIDGDPDTYWRVPEADGQREQAELLIDFQAPVSISGVVMMSRQNSREHQGDIREYALRSSDDGVEWQDVIRGTLVSTFAPQKIRFPKPITTQHLRLISLSGFGNDRTTSLAEFAVITPRLKSPAKN